jgi:HSP20 family protein
MDWKKIAPWNWFRKEQERDVPVARDPFAALRGELDRVFEDTRRRFGSGGLLPPAWPRALGDAGAVLRPSLDISEGRKAYTIRVEVPGVEKGDLTLRVEDDTLLIRGEKRQEREESEEDYHCVERSYGVFERMLSLPADADPDGIDAKFRNGVLKVTIPKRAGAEQAGRTIEVRHE